MLFIFDLDDTTINSQHRQGETLADWIANNTPENVAKDSLLPLAHSWRTIDQSRDIVVVMTSRVIGDADLHFWLTLICGIALSTLVQRVHKSHAVS